MTTPTATIFLPYSALDDVILRGTRAAQPAASAVVPGTLYGVTDEGNVVERSSGTAWQAYSPTGGGGGAPAAHHATHETGGTDAITALSGGVITSGTVADARLSANVQLKPIAVADLPANLAYTDAANTFTADQTISKTLPSLVAHDTAQPTDARRFRIRNFGQQWSMAAISDAGVIQSTPLTLDRTGNVLVGANLTANGTLSITGSGTVTGGLGTTPLNASQLTSGTLPDARLSANVALLASPVFTGDPKAPTPTAGDNDTSLATTAFVQAAITGQARFNVSLVNSVAQSIPASTFTVLTFNSETFDVGNLHDPAVNPSRITVPAGGAGLWLLTAALTWSGSAGGVQRQGLLNKNGGTNLMTSVVAPSANYEPQNMLTVCVQLAVGEYVELMGYQDSGAALTTSYPKTVLTAARLF